MLRTFFLCFLFCTFVVLVQSDGHQCAHDYLTTQKYNTKLKYTSKINSIRFYIDATGLSIDLAYNHEEIVYINKLLQVNIGKLQNILQVKQTERVVFPSQMKSCGNMHIPSAHKTNGIENADIVLYVRVLHGGRCSHRNKVFAWADSCMYDQTGRPVAGFINFCINRFHKLSELEDQEETLHNLVHILMMSPNTLKNAGFDHNEAVPLKDGSHNVLLSTPKLIQVSRRHYGCDSARGVYIEGSHWKSTHMFGELMSRHNPDISDISMSVFSVFTLALFADSPWYTVNISLYSADKYAIGWMAGCRYLSEPNPGFVAATTEPGKDHSQLAKIVDNNKKKRLLPTTYTSSDQDAILLRHNLLRAALGQGSVETYESASNMLEMSWDTNLQENAQIWANTCATSHDVTSARQQASNWLSYVGQNFAWGTPSSYYGTQERVLGLVQSWWDEHKNWDYSTTGGTCRQGSCGHFTQMAWHNSNLLGCGLKLNCQTDYEVMLVCNYAPRGNYRGTAPWKQGTSCSNCSSTQSLCANGGLCSTTGQSLTTSKPILNGDTKVV